MKKSSKQKVYALLKKIKKGRVISYKQLAKKLNTHPRTIARILSQNKNPKIPCHRVVMSNRNLGGYNKGIRNKAKLLKKEGVEITNNKIDKNFFQKAFNQN